MFPPDIEEKVKEDFQEINDINFVLEFLKNLSKSKDYRIIRCILFLAKGDVNKLGELEDLANMDFRDLIMCAEYDYPSDIRIHDFSKSFEYSELR